jgi:hypothetical protein
MNLENQPLEPSGTVRDGWEPSHRPLRKEGRFRGRFDGKRPSAGPSRLLPATPRTHRAEQDDYSDGDGLEWYTPEEVARLARRSPSTIRNLISKYQLRRRIAWTTRRRLRRRITLVSPGVARWIVQVTLFRRSDLLSYPPSGGTR